MAAPEDTFLSFAREEAKARPMLVVATAFLLFMMGSFAGWVYEIANDLIVRHMFVPRAWLAGPWCPIYGVGALLIAAAISPHARHGRSGARLVAEVVAVAAGIALLTTGVELLGSYVCEWTMGSVPWDYSEFWGNFEGRIAPEFAMRFAAMGLLLVYWLDPLVVRSVRRSPRGAYACAASLLALVAADFVLEERGVWEAVIPRDGIPIG